MIGAWSLINSELLNLFHILHHSSLIHPYLIKKERFCPEKIRLRIRYEHFTFMDLSLTLITPSTPNRLRCEDGGKYYARLGGHLVRRL